jgi:hypothetical protein
MTHAVALLTISQAAFSEIAEKLRAAGYDHVFMPGGSIDLSGIALTPDPDQKFPPNIVEVCAADLTTAAFRKLYQIDNLGIPSDEA